MVGRKSKVLFDTIDLEILDTIEEASESGTETGVIDLANSIGLTHSNLKRHLEKLSKAGLVNIWRISSGNNRRLSLNTPITEERAMAEMTKEEVKELKDYEAFMKIINKLRLVEHQKETLYDISKEMNKKKKKKK